MRYETGGRADGALHTDPNDPGGRTRYGFSQRAHPDLDLDTMTHEQACKMYFDLYWLPARCEDLLGPIAIAHFDCAVHSGIDRANKILQAVVGAAEDGVFGDATFGSLQRYMAGRGPKMVAAKLVEQRLRFLIQLERGKMRWAFIEGFVARCFDLLARVSEDPLTPETLPR
jgi:lysozyme family protein